MWGSLIFYIPDSVYVKRAFEALAKCILHRRLLSTIRSSIVEPVGVGGLSNIFQDE